MVDKSVIDYYRFTKRNGLDRDISQPLLDENYSCLDKFVWGKQLTLKNALESLIHEGFDFEEEKYVGTQKRITQMSLDPEFYVSE